MRSIPSARVSSRLMSKMLGRVPATSIRFGAFASPISTPRTSPTSTPKETRLSCRSLITLRKWRTPNWGLLIVAQRAHALLGLRVHGLCSPGCGGVGRAGVNLLVPAVQLLTFGFRQSVRLFLRWIRLEIVEFPFAGNAHDELVCAQHDSVLVRCEALVVAFGGLDELGVGELRA